MKKTVYLFFLILIFHVNNVYGNFSGDITVEQDSLNPLKFTATIEFLSNRNINLSSDSIIFFWSNNTVQHIVAINDTVNMPYNRSLRIYKDSYTFPSNTSGIKVVGAKLFNRPPTISNIDFGESFNVNIYVEAGLNIDLLKSTLATKSLKFGSVPFMYETPNKAIYHPALINTVSSDSFTVELVEPQTGYNFTVSFYTLPHEITASKNDTSYIDSQGNFYWDTTYSQGYYCIAFKAKEYLNGELLYFTMRDMLVMVVNQTTSIEDKPTVNLSLSIFPNPTSDFITVNYSNSSPYNSQLLIINTIGEIIFKIDQIRGYLTDTFNLSTSELPEGIYYIQISNGNKTEQKKFVVHH